MTTISRASLPAEFYDITSSSLLMQPEPEYFHAVLIMNALRAKEDFSAKWGLPIPGREFGGEPGRADYASLREMMVKLVGEPDPVYGDAIKVVAEFMTNTPTGHTIRINRPKFTDSTATRAARRIPVSTAISKSPIAVGSEQAQITIERMGGPYDDTAGEVRPFGIERFDANRMIHDPASLKDLHLTRDFRRAVDTWGVQLFDQGSAIYPAGMSADNDSTTAGDFPFSYELCTRVEEDLSNNKIPRFSNGRYMMVITPRQAQQLKVDNQYLRLVQYHKDVNPVFKANYRGTIGTLDMFESVTLTRTNNSSSVPIQYGQAFGPQSVGFAMTEMPRVAPNTDDNYGETALIIWLWYCGFDVLDARFQRSVRSS